MTIQEYALVFIGVSVASAAMITLAYRNVEQGTHAL
jgi:hypothetical protein